MSIRPMFMPTVGGIWSSGTPLFFVCNNLSCSRVVVFPALSNPNITICSSVLANMYRTKPEIKENIVPASVVELTNGCRNQLVSSLLSLFFKHHASPLCHGLSERRDEYVQYVFYDAQVERYTPLYYLYSTLLRPCRIPVVYRYKWILKEKRRPGQYLSPLAYCNMAIHTGCLSQYCKGITSSVGTMFILY